MNKVIRDGKVAVLIAPGWGAGWYTWNGIEEMLFDPKIVAMIENPDDDEDSDTIVEYCKVRYGNECYLGGVDDLMIVWVPEGKKFIVREHDGAEFIEFQEDFRWLTA
jgi:hypothetical protein